VSTRPPYPNFNQGSHWFAIGASLILKSGKLGSAQQGNP
jgi:hypothetical protein